MCECEYVFTELNPFCAVWHGAWVNTAMTAWRQETCDMLCSWQNSSGLYVISCLFYLCSAGVGGGQTSGSLGLSSGRGLGKSTGLSTLKLSRVFTRLLTCSYSSASSCRTWAQRREKNSIGLSPSDYISCTNTTVFNTLPIQANVIHSTIYKYISD